MLFLRFNKMFACIHAIVFITIFIVCSGSPVVAAEESAEKKAVDGVTPESTSVLDPVVVVGDVESNASGATIIHSDRLSDIPNRNGSINEALTVAPGVQFSDIVNDSYTAGEILPPNISIAGGRVYQNNFLIDGFSNNSLLDPVQESTTSSTVMPGHPQELFVNARLVDHVTVYDSNVPAEYGSFTGGVVDAELIRPGKQFSGSFFYRTTRDEWTSFHVDAEDLEDFENSNSALSGQPNFEKHDFGTILNLPVSENSGLVLSYQQLYSQIPLQHFGEVKNQDRRLENIYVKYGGTPSPESYAELSLLYTPYSGHYFRKNTMNSDYTVHGGGLLIGARWERQFNTVFWEAQAGYRRSENSREAPSHLFGWAVSPTKPWGGLIGSTRSDEGMLGDLESTQESWQVKSDMTFSSFRTGFLTHSVKTGFDFENIRGTYDRPETSWQFYRFSRDYYDPTDPTPVDLIPESSVVCDPGDIACIDGEQYFNRRFVYAATYGSAEMNSVGLYIQDTMQLNRLQLRPGLRVSYDDLMDNLNVAPRFAASYDLLGNGRSRLIGGWNRYYGKSLLTYKLREVISPSSMQDARSLLTPTPEPWAQSSGGSTIYRFSELETPYKDEVNIGLEQRIYNGLLTLRYVNRVGKNEFAKQRIVDPADFNYYIMTNDGRSDYESFLFAWQQTWEKHYLDFNVIYQQTNTGNEDYSDTLLDIQLERKIWYEGELISWDERPREDYSRPWVANLTYNTNIGQGFTFTNFTKYRSAYFAIKDTRVNSPIDGNDVYERVKQPSTVVFDWILAWQSPLIKKGRHFVLTAELYNVFNKKTHLGDSDDEYELGRQFWAGVEYRF